MCHYAELLPWLIDRVCTSRTFELVTPVGVRILCRGIHRCYIEFFLIEHITPLPHFSDVIMSAMASQFTGVTIVFLNHLFRRISNKTSKLRVTGLCGRNSPVIGGFSAQRSYNAENVSIWLRHHAGSGRTNLSEDLHHHTGCQLTLNLFQSYYIW